MNKENKAIFHHITYKDFFKFVDNFSSIATFFIAGLFVILNISLIIPFLGITLGTHSLITGSNFSLANLFVSIAILYLPIISNQIINTYLTYKSRKSLTLFDFFMIPFNHFDLNYYFVFYPFLFSKIIFSPTILTNSIFILLKQSKFMNKKLISHKKLELEDHTIKHNN